MSIVAALAAAVASPIAVGSVALDSRTVYTAGSAAADPHTFNHTSTAGDLLIVKVTLNHSTAVVSAVRWGGSGGTLLTEVTAAARTNGNVKTRVFRLIAPAAGTNQVWIDLSGVANLGAEAVTLTGTHQTTPIVATAGVAYTSTSSPVVSSALVPGGSGRWLETVLAIGVDTTTSTPGGGQSESADFDAGNHRYVGGFQAAVGASVTPSWALSSSPSGAASAVLVQPA